MKLMSRSITAFALTALLTAPSLADESSVPFKLRAAIVMNDGRILPVPRRRFVLARFKLVEKMAEIKTNLQKAGYPLKRPDPNDPKYGRACTILGICVMNDYIYNADVEKQSIYSASMNCQSQV